MTRRITNRRRLARRNSRVDTLDLCLDTSSIWCTTDRWEDRTDGIDQTLLHGTSGIVYGSLDNIIGIAVTEETLKLGLSREHLVNKHIAALVLSAAKTLLYNIGRELLAGELADLAFEHVDKWLSKDWLVEVKYVLDDIVAEGVLDKNKGAIGDLADQPGLLLAGGVVDAALENAAAVTVGTDVDAVDTNSVEDELRVLGRKLVKALLNNVVTVQILDKLDNLVAESLNNDRHLLLGRDKLYHLLQSSCSVLVQSNADEIGGRVQDQDSALLIVAELKKLLTQVVTERIGHQLDNVGVGLLPNEVDMFLVAALKLLLQETAAMLVLAESVDLSAKGL